MSEPLVVLMTAGSQEEAEKIAQALVGEMLAACVNVVPGVTSVYRWEGEVQSDQEWLLVAKSRRDVLDDLVQRVQALHSYDVPEILALPVAGGSEAYLRWVDDGVSRLPARCRIGRLIMKDLIRQIVRATSRSTWRGRTKAMSCSAAKSRTPSSPCPSRFCPV